MERTSCTSLVNGSGKFKNVKHVYTGEKGTDTWGCYLQATRIEDNEVVKGTEVTIKMAKMKNGMARLEASGKPCQS